MVPLCLTEDVTWSPCVVQSIYHGLVVYCRVCIMVCCAWKSMHREFVVLDEVLSWFRCAWDMM